MKFIYPLFIMAFIFSNAYGQSVKDEEIKFKYRQLPIQPIKNVENYKVDVILAYEAAILSEEAKAKAEYDAAMANYPAQVEAAKVQYDEEMKKYEIAKKAWDEKSSVSKLVEKKILEENNAPVKPYYNTPSTPYLRTVPHDKIFNKEMLANSYIKLEGFNKSDENALIVTTTLYGFDDTELELKSEEKSTVTTNKDKTTTTTKYRSYWYEASYKHPINLKVQTPTGEVLFDETLSEFNEYKLYKSAANKNSAPSINQAELKEQLEDKIVKENMAAINALLNDRFGFPTMTRSISVNIVKPKKHNYDDYDNAFDAVSDGYKTLFDDYPKASEKIKEAIAIWEKALEESNLEDKKARIDADVTIATYFNLIEAYLWLNDYEKVKSYMRTVGKLKISRKENKLLEDYEVFYKSQKDRSEANQ